jgi:diguanylate cyclase (GGDEF)-like protein
VDHFKRFNDVHGHNAGDAALRMVADELRASFRESDLVARYGGEEFAILLPETPADAALAKLQEACSRLAAARMLIGRTKTGRLTVSAGVAAWPGDDHDLEQWVARADRRLYVAKAGGRNRVVGPEAGEAGTGAETTEGDDDDDDTLA